MEITKPSTLGEWITYTWRKDLNNFCSKRNGQQQRIRSMEQFLTDSEENRPQEQKTEIHQKTTGAISLIAIPVQNLQTQTAIKKENSYKGLKIDV